MRAKFIYEKFVEDSDPISDMNIGMIHQIKLWMTSINEPFENKNQALSICAKEGKTDYVKYLLSAGADVHANDDYALRWASGSGHIELVKVLLSAGADVHARNDNALQWASNNGHIEVVKVLLSAGADVHAGDDWALRLASNNGHTEVVKVLKDWIAKEKKTKKTKVRESLNEKFTEDGSDPIADMNIGLKPRFKNLVELFDNADYKQWIYTIRIDKSSIFFFFNHSVVRMLPLKEEEKLFDYVNDIIKKLGFRSILIRPKKGDRVFSASDAMISNIKYKIQKEFQNILKVQDYRRKGLNKKFEIHIG